MRLRLLCDSCTRPLQKVPRTVCNAVGVMYRLIPLFMRAHRAAQMQHLVTNRSGLCGVRFHAGVNFALPRPDALSSPPSRSDRTWRLARIVHCFWPIP